MSLTETHTGLLNVLSRPQVLVCRMRKSGGERRLGSSPSSLPVPGLSCCTLPHSASAHTGWVEPGPARPLLPGRSLGKGEEHGGLAGYLPCLGGRCDLR
jgi:hypothetical protein